MTARSLHVIKIGGDAHRLPEIPNDAIPGWGLTQRIVAISVLTFLATIVGSIALLSIADMSVTVDGVGIVEPERVVPVRATEGGTILEVEATTGQRVNRGQLIALLDSLTPSASATDLGSQITLLGIELNRLQRSAPLDIQRSRLMAKAASARVDEARTNLRARMVEFRIQGDPDSIADASDSRIHVGLDGPAAAYRAAKAELESVEAEVQSAKLVYVDIRHKKAELERLKASQGALLAHVERMSIRSPTDGIVMTDQPKSLVGSAVAAGQTLLEVADISRWRATVIVSERDVHQLHIGDGAMIEIPAFSELPVDRFPGRVEAIALQTGSTDAFSAAAVSALSGFKVMIRLDSTAIVPINRGALRRGYAANAQIITRSGKMVRVLLDKARGQIHQIVR